MKKHRLGTEPKEVLFRNDPISIIVNHIPICQYLITQVLTPGSRTSASSVHYGAGIVFQGEHQFSAREFLSGFLLTRIKNSIRIIFMEEKTEW
jgi:hypothetical protein